MNIDDLSPTGRTGAQLVDALWQAYELDRRDMHDAIAQLTVHPDPVVREEALSLLLVKWTDRRHRPAAASALIRDEDAGVRARAAIALASVSDRNSRREDASLLLRVLQDPREDLEVRRAAYEGLLIQLGATQFPPRSKRFDPQSDIDWTVLRELTGG